MISIRRPIIKAHRSEKMANTSYDISKAMEKIDELADTIGSADYLNLANALMDLHRRSQYDRRPTPVSASASASAEPVRHPLDILQERAEDYCDEHFHTLFKNYDKKLVGFFRDYLTAQFPDDEDFVLRVCCVMGDRYYRLRSVILYKTAIITTKMKNIDELVELTRTSIKDRVLTPYNKPRSSARPYKVRVSICGQSPIPVATDETTQYIRLGGRLYHCYLTGRMSVEKFIRAEDLTDYGYYPYKSIMRNSRIENGLITFPENVRLRNGNAGMNRQEEKHRTYTSVGGFIMGGVDIVYYEV